MIKKVVIECSRCRQTCELFLSTDARIIIFNCPSCWTPVMYFRNRVFVLSRHQVNEIRNRAPRGSIMKILQKIVGTGAEMPTAEHETHACASCSGRQEPCLINHKVRAPDGGTITRDDITNLRISLETCEDAQQFIDSLA